MGCRVEEIFAPETSLGAAVLAAFQRSGNVLAEVVLLEDGRPSGTFHWIASATSREPVERLERWVTLRDKESVLQLEQELEVSRRLAAIGRITAGVGHEVKNPINAMGAASRVAAGKACGGGEWQCKPWKRQQRGSEACGDTRQRDAAARPRGADLWRTFSRPMELHLKRVDLRDIVASVIELTWEQIAGGECYRSGGGRPESRLMVHVDSDLVRQALLNLVLNGMQSMSEGGVVHILLRREQQLAVIEVKDKGIGIQEELLPRIFDLYFTTKKTGAALDWLPLTASCRCMVGASMYAQ